MKTVYKAIFIFFCFPVKIMYVIVKCINNIQFLSRSLNEITTTS